MALAYVAEVPLEENVRAEVLQLVSRLLLHAARARNSGREESDDRA
jgi:hypothetical protein